MEFSLSLTAPRELVSPTRRGFLAGLGAAIVAPSIVRADSLMRMGMHERIVRYAPMIVNFQSVGAALTECWMYDCLEDRVAWIKSVPRDSAQAEEWRRMPTARTHNFSSWGRSTASHPSFEQWVNRAENQTAASVGGLWTRERDVIRMTPHLPSSQFSAPHAHPAGGSWPWNEVKGGW